MHLEMIPLKWLDYQPPSNCHDFGIGETIAAVTAAASSLAPEAAAGAGAAAEAGTAAALGTGGLYAATAGASVLPSLGTIGAVAGGAGTLLSAKAGLDNAAYQSDVAKTEATVEAQNANAAAATGEQKQIAATRQTDLVLSRARAVGAASGTDAGTGDILTTEGRIAGQGQYNALSSLYQGQTAARSDTYQSTIDLFNASRIGTAAPLSAAGTILGGISSFADKRARLRYFTSGGGENFFGFGAA